MQHKQIRRHYDVDDHTSQQDNYGGSPDFSSALPPSGAGTNQDLWFDSASSAAPVDGSSAAAEQQPALPSPGNDGVETSGEVFSGGANISGTEQTTSALASIGQMQSALPDIPGKSSPE